MTDGGWDDGRILGLGSGRGDLDLSTAAPSLGKKDFLHDSKMATHIRAEQLHAWDRIRVALPAGTIERGASHPMIAHLAWLIDSMDDRIGGSRVAINSRFIPSVLHSSSI